MAGGGMAVQIRVFCVRKGRRAWRMAGCRAACVPQAGRVPSGKSWPCRERGEVGLWDWCRYQFWPVPR